MKNVFWKRAMAVLGIAALLASNAADVMPALAEDTAAAVTAEEGGSQLASADTSSEPGATVSDEQDASSKDSTADDSSVPATADESKAADESAADSTSNKTGNSTASVTESSASDTSTATSSAVSTTGSTADNSAVASTVTPAPSKTVYTYEDSSISVTATLTDAAAIPDDATLVVEPITEETNAEEYNEKTALVENAKKNDSKITINNYRIYDIHFEENGKEIEPSNGSVSVIANLIEDQLTTESGIQILHIDDTNDVNVVKNVCSQIEGGEVEKVAFSVDSFSTFFIGADGKTTTTGKPSSTVRAFTNPSSDSLGSLVNYGVFAMNFTQTVHMEGNFAVKQYISKGQAFGLTDNVKQNYSEDENYIYMEKIDNLTSLVNTNSNQYLSDVIIGNEYVITNQYNNGTGISISDSVNTKNYNNITDIGSSICNIKDSQYVINFTDAFTGLKEYASAKYSSTSTVMPSVDADVIKVQCAAGGNIVNINATDLENHTLVITGPATQDAYSLIINVKGLDKTNYSFSKNVSIDGASGGYSNVAKNVLFNFGDDYNGTITFGESNIGAVLAPSASVEIPTTHNGSVYAENVDNTSGEIHQNGFHEQPIGSLTVTKTVAGEGGSKSQEFSFTVTLSDKTISGTYKDMTFVNGVAEFTLKDGESKEATGLAQGLTYTVTEADYSAEHYATTSTGDTGTIGTGASVAAFTNTYTAPTTPTGSLTVTKTVAGEGGSKSQEFSFTVTLSDKTISGTYKDMTFVNGVAEFTMKDGESKEATGLAQGLTYTVTEADYSAEHYATTSTGDTGTIGTGASVAAFTNTYTAPTTPTGSLTVTKTVAGEGGSKSQEFSFTVTLSDKTISGTYKDMTFVNGVAEFTMKDGESKEATGLAQGLTYTVTEADYSAEHYATTSTGDTGTIGTGASAAAFTNTYTAPTTPTGSITVTKNVTVDNKTTTGTKADGTYYFALYDSASNKRVSSIKSLIIKNGESATVTFEDIPYNSYAVYEMTDNTTNAMPVSGTVRTNIKLTTANGVIVTLNNEKTKASASFKNNYTTPVTPNVNPVYGSVKVEKTTSAGAALKGAKLQIINASGSVVDSWTSDGTVHTKSDLVEGTYKIQEISAPTGYAIAEEIAFSIDSNGNTIYNGRTITSSITMVDESSTTPTPTPSVPTVTPTPTPKTNSTPTRFSLTFSKVNASGMEIAGAKLVLKNAAGTEAASWTTTANESYTVKDLVTGKYTLHEDSAPEGYALADDITITIGSDGTITSSALNDGKVVMLDVSTTSTTSSTPTNNTTTSSTPTNNTTTSSTPAVNTTTSSTPTVNTTTSTASTDSTATTASSETTTTITNSATNGSSTTNTSTSSVKTGDESSTAFYITLMALAAIVVGVWFAMMMSRKKDSDR
jgi:hypothetical protein